MPTFPFTNQIPILSKGTEIIHNRQNKSEIVGQRPALHTCVAARTSSLDGFSLKMSLSASALFEIHPPTTHQKTEHYTQCLDHRAVRKHIHPTTRQKTEHYTQCLDSHNTALYKIQPSNMSENRTLHSVPGFLLHRAVANTACNASPQQLSYRDFKFSLLESSSSSPAPPIQTCKHMLTLCVCVCVCEHVACKEHTIIVLYYFWGYVYIFYNPATHGVLTLVSNILFSSNARYYYHYPSTAEAKKIN